MIRQPYIPLYLGDWIQDTDCLSIGAEGAWLRIIFKCWKNNGVFSATAAVFARVCKVDEIVFASILLEWKTNDICDIIEDTNGIITVMSRRIRRDKENSAKKAVNGSKGGSKTQANHKAKTKQKCEYEIDNDNGIVNTEKEPEKKLFDSYDSGEHAFSEIQKNEQMIEGMLRSVRTAGFQGCSEIVLMKAVKHFITTEAAKPDFTRRPRDEIKKHVVNWVRVKAKILNQYGGI